MVDPSNALHFVPSFGGQARLIFKKYAGVVKLVNTHDSKSCAVRLVGSSPTSGTKIGYWKVEIRQ